MLWAPILTVVSEDDPKPGKEQPVIINEQTNRAIKIVLLIFLYMVILLKQLPSYLSILLVRLFVL
ncbi:hypothetical protein SRABI84_05319 [Peribacillus simplex]|nr:hypothetical protein SRABI84_05319 [Peribacillus simplex]